MKEFLFTTPIRNKKPLFEETDLNKLRDWYEEFDNQSLEWCIRTPEEVRRLRANRYYRGGVLPVFVPAIFQTESEAHNYFTEKYLSQVDVIDIREDSYIEFLCDIGHKRSQSRPTIKRTQIDEYTFEIRWVKSTAVLSKKQFADYVNKVIFDGQTEHGLEFKSIEQFNEYRR